MKIAIKQQLSLDKFVSKKDTKMVDENEKKESTTVE